MKLKPSVMNGGRSPLGVVAASAWSKLLVMLTAGVISFITTRLIIQHFGMAAYAQYGLLASMASLVPFADLGMSAAVINAVAGSKAPASDQHVHRVLLSAFRTLLGSAVFFMGFGVVISLLGLWSAVLGEGLMPGGQVAAMVCVVIFALSLPLGVGQRLLTGLGKNHVQIRTQFIAAPFILVGVLTLVFAGDAGVGNYLAVLAYGSSACVAGTSLWLASRLIRPQVGEALKSVFSLRAKPGTRTMNVALPMLAQMVALPIAMQTDRLLLSHLGSTSDLAQYNLAAQLFGMILQTIGAAGVALWPIFAKARSHDVVRSPAQLTYVFLVGSLVAGCLLAALMPWAARILSDGEIRVDLLVLVGFVAFVVAQAVKYPLGMYMTDPKGLKFQVLPIFVLVPLNLVISWALIKPAGAAGPIIGSAVAVVLCQVAPNAWYVRRDLGMRRRQAVVAGVGR